MDQAQRHGTRSTYQQGCHCMPCRAAEANYRAALRRLRAKGIQPLGATISAVEAWRRIRQIQTEHVAKAEIARRAGLPSPRLRLHPTRITVRTLLRIRRAYRLFILDGSDGPSAPCR